MQTARILVSALLAGVAVSCTSFFEVPIEMPIQAKLDVAAFSRVYVAGFVGGGSEDVDANLETVRLLRSQLRAKSGLKVIDADVQPLQELALRELPALPADATADPAGGAPEARVIKDDKDLELIGPLFENAEHWRKIGEEFQGPLIITGTVLFQAHSRSGYVQRDQEAYDEFGRRRTVPVRTYMERRGFILKPRFIFIDGRTGETLYTETFREEVLYNAQQSTPALSSYFELMDRLLPNVLATLSTQKIKGSRVLLR